MTIQAGFAEVNIDPTLKCAKIGWIREIIATKILDSLFARVAIFANDKQQIAFIQLDLLSIRWTQVNEIRAGIQKKYGFPGKNIMVSTTHTHAGPASSSIGKVKRDEKYIKKLVGKCIQAFGKALKNLKDVEIGFGHTYNFDIAHNRRTVIRNGLVKTHYSLTKPDALYQEGPIDPELAVLAVRNIKSKKIIGCMVNYACHPTHHGPDEYISAGFPGVLAKKIKRTCPITLFLNGAYGNVHTSNPTGLKSLSMEEAGDALCKDTKKVFKEIKFHPDIKLGARLATVKLPYRQLTKKETTGKAIGAQRFVDSKIYDTTMPNLVKRIKKRKTQPADIQILQIGNQFFAGIPAEYFVEHSLRIKTESYPKHALVVGSANGMVGYVPTKDAFKRGGYETTLGPPSRLGPDAGDIMADKAIELINKD